MTPIIEAAHRPWPLPRQPWIMAQTWNDLLFAHWPLDPPAVQRLIPRSLQLDLWEDRAWVGVVPFRMSAVHPRFTPSVPQLSAFAELNVRTYVVQDGKPGVFFWSLDAANPVAVAIARNIFYLPYFRARMGVVADGDRIRYTSVRTHRGAPPASFVGEYGPVGPVEVAQKGSLADWLTARYCLYTIHKQRVYRAEIHHRPWPLQPATATITTNTMATAQGLQLPTIDPLLHFAHRLEVIVWPLQRIS